MVPSSLDTVDYPLNNHGFGESEIFPALTEFQCEGILDNRLKMKQLKFEQVTRDKNAMIIVDPENWTTD